MIIKDFIFKLEKINNIVREFYYLDHSTTVITEVEESLNKQRFSLEILLKNFISIDLAKEKIDIKDINIILELLAKIKEKLLVEHAFYIKRCEIVEKIIEKNINADPIIRLDKQLSELVSYAEEKNMLNTKIIIDLHFCIQHIKS